jgi:alkanesulfonate monooxygenase SsuD/methylene tetrahydromethanopterin reductase-like flavin-dependent oxidoreductase (luciferase family)
MTAQSHAPSRYTNALGEPSAIKVGATIPFIAGRQPGAAERRAALTGMVQAGLDHVVFGDHVSFQGGHGTDALIQAAAALGARRDLDVYVGAYLLPLRHPVPVARQLADLADLAPGRLTLAVGVGGEDRTEITACGIDPGTRGVRTNESLIVLRRLLSGEPVSFAGEHIVLDNIRILPTPSTAVPLVVAGRSAAALTRAARHGDGWLGIWTSPARYAEAIASISEQAVTAGRDPVALRHGLNVWCGLAGDPDRAQDSVARAMQDAYRLPFAAFERWSPAGPPDAVADFLAPYLEAGCTTFNLIACGDDTDTVIELAAGVRTLLQAGSIVQRATPGT